jgi:hypothetical protein
MEPKDRQLPEPNAPGKKSYQMTSGVRPKIDLDDEMIAVMRPESYVGHRNSIYEWHDKPEKHHTYMEYNNKCSECKALHVDRYYSRHPQA